MIRPCIAALLAFFFGMTLAWTTPAFAKGNACIRSCKLETSTCIETDCADLRGKAKRQCKGTCRAKTGCGGPRIRTLAYVVSQCNTDADGVYRSRQELRIRRGSCDPVTISFCAGGVNNLRLCMQPADCPGGVCGGLLVGPVPEPLPGLCQVYGGSRAGESSVAVGLFQRLAVSLDGSRVAFEVTDNFTVLPPLTPVLGSEQEGIFIIRSDGTRLRRLGPASRHSTFRFLPDFPLELGHSPRVLGGSMAFSPDGRTLALSDRGLGPDGEDAPQLVTLDVATGRRFQATRLPALPAVGLASGTSALIDGVRFVDDDTVVFSINGDLDGMHPNGTTLMSKTDGTRLRVLPNPAPLPGSRFDPRFVIVGGGTNLVTVFFEAEAVNADAFPLSPQIKEVFLVDGKNFLQLTKFDRADTYKTFLSVNQRRAFFYASADPLGTNPSNNCQLFSIDTLGRRRSLRQLTHFRETDHARGCTPAQPGCTITYAFQDPVTETVVFDSSCDPLGTNPLGSQMFAMRPNGSRLRQLTDTRAMVTHADGSVEVELPGPWKYSALD